MALLVQLAPTVHLRGTELVFEDTEIYLLVNVRSIPSTIIPSCEIEQADADAFQGGAEDEI